MGLLDDAIREHLELKRLSGADPGAVAREEQDALGSVRREGEADRAGQDESEKGSPPVAEGSSSPDVDANAVADSSVVGQETIEINMEAEFASGADSEHKQEASRLARGGPTAHPGHAPTTAEESLEWEVPSNRSDGPKGQEGPDVEADSRVVVDHETGEQVEDVLEETPDFLRDTPEQERLWFEQRPPRDFDFNE
jgi:hypothetical protein